MPVVDFVECLANDFFWMEFKDIATLPSNTKVSRASSLSSLIETLDYTVVKPWPILLFYKIFEIPNRTPGDISSGEASSHDSPVTSQKSVIQVNTGPILVKQAEMGTSTISAVYGNSAECGAGLLSQSGNFVECRAKPGNTV